MTTRYWVNCFERELCIEWDDAYKHLEKEILDMLDNYYMEWHSVEEIEDPDYKEYVEDSCCEEFMIEKLSETYNMWDFWWIEGDVDEEGNEVTPHKTLREEIKTKYITQKLIEDGLMAKVIVPKLEENELVCHIGDYWFYFGGSEFEYTDPNDIPFSVLVNEIKDVLDDFYKHPEIFGDEYMYYYYYLCEHI